MCISEKRGLTVASKIRAIFFLIFYKIIIKVNVLLHNCSPELASSVNLDNQILSFFRKIIKKFNYKNNYQIPKIVSFKFLQL